MSILNMNKIQRFALLLVLVAPWALADAPGEIAVANPYGLEALLKSGDVIALFTLAVLLVMSAGSWYILITKWLEQKRLFGEARDAQEHFWSAESVTAGAANLAPESAFRYIAEAASQAMAHHEGPLMEQIDRHTWVTMTLDRSVSQVQGRLQEGLTFLATVGSTGPFVGLFGTVMGIYHALTAIGIAGQASIDKVAGPVGEALIMTAIGLAVAVPAVLGYNALVRRNKVLLEQVRSFAADIHGVLLGNEQNAVRRA
jgi:biopolymer transport protein ExbB